MWLLSVVATSADYVQRCHSCAAEWVGGGQPPLETMARPRFAVVTTLVETMDRGYRGIKRHTASDLVARAGQLACSLRHDVNYTGPLIAIVHSGPDGLQTLSGEALRSQGWILYNVTERLNHRLANVKGNSSLALPPATSKVYSRSDGWATLYKYFAFTLLQLDYVLSADNDVTFLESPAAALEAAAARRLVFQSGQERGVRHYSGLNTHMMLLRPSMLMYSLLMTNAVVGRFMPYTKTEQDVTESTLPPVVTEDWDAGDAVEFPRHVHRSGYQFRLPSTPRCKALLEARPRGTGASLTSPAVATHAIDVVKSPPARALAEAYSTTQEAAKEAAAKRAAKEAKQTKQRAALNTWVQASAEAMSQKAKTAAKAGSTKLSPAAGKRDAAKATKKEAIVAARPADAAKPPPPPPTEVSARARSATRASLAAASAELREAAKAAAPTKESLAACDSACRGANRLAAGLPGPADEYAR